MKNEKVIYNFKKNVNKKKVLFISTREITYIRNSQEIRLLEKDCSQLTILASEQKNYFFRLIEIYTKLLFLRKDLYELIFIGFAPQLVLPFFAWKFRKKEIMIDFFVSLYDTFVLDRKRFSQESMIARLMHHLDESTLKMAKNVVVDTKADMKFFSSEFHCPQNKFSILYLEADKNIYYAREQHKAGYLKDKYVVFYFGSILPLQGIDVVLNAVKMLKDNSTIFFQIVGPISSIYEKPIQNNVEYIDWLSQKQLAEYIANADLCLAGHFNGTIDKANRTIPGKAFIYKSMNKKMILGNTSANHEIFSPNDNIKFVTTGNSEELVQIIEKSYEQFIDKTPGTFI